MRTGRSVRGRARSRAPVAASRRGRGGGRWGRGLRVPRGAWGRGRSQGVSYFAAVFPPRVRQAEPAGCVTVRAVVMFWRKYYLIGREPMQEAPQKRLAQHAGFERPFASGDLRKRDLPKGLADLSQMAIYENDSPSPPGPQAAGSTGYRFGVRHPPGTASTPAWTSTSPRCAARNPLRSATTPPPERGALPCLPGSAEGAAVGLRADTRGPFEAVTEGSG